MAARDLNPAGTPAAFGDPPLTARPEGLLSLLGIQSGGRYPQTLAPTLQPQLDLLQWYAEYNATFRGSVSFGAFTSPAVGGLIPTTLEVPQGEIWLLSRVGLTLPVTYLGGGEANWALVRTNNADATELHLDYWKGTVVAGGGGTSIVYLGANARLPMILRPTVRLQVQFLGGTALTPTTAVGGGEINIQFTRCLV